ncbi:hypothetical protein CN190_31475 [Sinorhizobium meliloti]|nr:hypothetical protein CN190_31475 [Sinorhizobium meliloti]RVQ53933.1 hypothetical protein CN245_21305 [Sinorhizobium meliloti]
MAEIAQVIGQHIVTRVVQDFVIRHEIDLEVVGDDHLVRSRSRDEPSFRRHAILRGKEDILVLQAFLVRAVQDGRSPPRADAFRQGLQCFLGFFPRHTIVLSSVVG